MAAVETLHSEDGMSPDEWFDHIVREAAERYANVNMAMKFIRHQFDQKRSLYKVLVRKTTMSAARTRVHSERARMRSEADRKAPDPGDQSGQNATARADVRAEAGEARDRIMDTYTVGDKWLRDCLKSDVTAAAKRFITQAEGTYQKHVFMCLLARHLPDEETPVGEVLSETLVRDLLEQARSAELQER